MYVFLLCCSRCADDGSVECFCRNIPKFFRVVSARTEYSRGVSGLSSIPRMQEHRVLCVGEKNRRKFPIRTIGHETPEKK